MVKVILLGLLVALVLAIKFLPWYVTLGGVVLLIVGGKVLGGRVLRSLFLQPFKMKGAVLANAGLVVSEVTPVDTPETLIEAPLDEFITDEELGPRRWLTIDATIQPKEPTGSFTHWEPGELRFVPPGVDGMDLETEDDTCYVRQLWVHEDGDFAVDDGYKFEGEKRIKFLVAVKPGHKRLVAQYYFEQFGTIDLSGTREALSV